MFLPEKKFIPLGPGVGCIVVDNGTNVMKTAKDLGLGHTDLVFRSFSGNLPIGLINPSVSSKRLAQLAVCLSRKGAAFHIQCGHARIHWEQKKLELGSPTADASTFFFVAMDQEEVSEELQRKGEEEPEGRLETDSEKKVEGDH